MTKRQDKVAKQIQKDLGEVFQRMGTSKFQGELITVTGVNISPDLGYAKIYLSFLSGDKEGMLEQLELNKKDIRKELASKMKNQLKKVPELEFFIDDTLDRVWKMEKLFESLKKKDNSSEGE